MKIVGEPKAFLSNEALQLLNLYESLGQRAEIFLPRHIFDNLTSFVSLCMEEPDDPAKQQAEINRYLLKFREDIPGYTHVSLMLIPHKQLEGFRAEQQARRIRPRKYRPCSTPTARRPKSRRCCVISATATTCRSARLRSTAAISISCLRYSWAAMCATCASTAT